MRRQSQTRRKERACVAILPVLVLLISSVHALPSPQKKVQSAVSQRQHHNDQHKEKTHHRHPRYHRNALWKTPSRGGNVEQVERIATGLWFALERHTLSALAACGVFCVGIVSLWMFVDEGWYFLASYFQFEKQLPWVQLVVGSVLARTNGWVWWHFLNGKQYQALEEQLESHQKRWDMLLIHQLYGTWTDHVITILSYISIMSALGAFYQAALTKLVGTTTDSRPYILVSGVVTWVTAIALKRMIDYNMLLHMWFTGEESE